MKYQNFEKHIGHVFDSYCKKCIKRNLLDLQRKEKRQSEREISFSDMSAHELLKLSVIDKYFKDEYIFEILGESIGVSDIDLAEALTALPADKREIILMSFFFGMTDKEIAGKLNMARRTVAYKRTSSLQELKKTLESED